MRRGICQVLHMSSRGHRCVDTFLDLLLDQRPLTQSPPSFPTEQQTGADGGSIISTKWDIYNCFTEFEEEPSDYFSVSFQTAWALGEKRMEVLSKQFPGAVLTNSYDEGATSVASLSPRTVVWITALISAS